MINKVEKWDSKKIRVEISKDLVNKKRKKTFWQKGVAWNGKKWRREENFGFVWQQRIELPRTQLFWLRISAKDERGP